MKNSGKRRSTHIIRLAAAVILLLFSQSCTKTSDMVNTDPATLLAAVPGGFRYELTRGNNPVVYQAPPTEPTYKYPRCDTIIGQKAYEALKQFLQRNGIKSAIISEDHSTFIFELPRVMDPNEIDAYIFHTDAELSESAVIQNANALYYEKRPFTQSNVINEKWVRVTPFDGRAPDYMGIFYFK